MSISPSELETILAERLDLIRKEKSAIRENVELLEAKVKNTRAQMVQVPREKDEELVALLEKIEHTHNTTPQTNAAEREFMREKEKIRQKRKALATYNKLQAEVNDLRARLTDLRRSQAEKDDAITELHQGLRKIRVSNKTGCASAEIAERKLTVEASKVSRIVGRGGSNLRFIESEHGVSIEIDNNGGGVRIMGTESAIEAAFAAVMTIVETSIEEFSLSDEIIVCLMMDKAQRVNDIQAQFGVRLDISRAKNLCKVTGLTDSVTAAKALILSLQSIRTDVLMETSALSAIIGKGGASITALQEEFGVAINVNRERSTVEVVGMRPDVNAAVAKIKEIVETNREVEEIIQLEKHVLLGCLMASGAQNLRGVSRDFGVRVDVDSSKEAKEAALQTIKIKGTHGRVSQAKAHIVLLVGEFLSNSLVFEVADDVIPAILGKGGSGIKAFREKYPTANIDIEGTNIHIQSYDAAERAGIKEEIDAIIDANFSQLVDFSDEAKSQLRSTQGAEIRNAITKDLDLRLVVEGSATAVKVRGARANVEKAVALLEEFKQTHSNVKMVLSDEDYPLLLANRSGEESIAKQFEARFQVEIRSSRKDLTLIINGSPENVVRAKAAIDGILLGEAQYGAQIVDIHKLVLSALIGKGGSNIAKMEADLGVKFDVVKTTSQLRILAASEEKVLLAKQAVQKFVHNCRITDTIAVPPGMAKKDFEAVIKRATDIFQTDIAPSTTSNNRTDKTDNEAETAVPAKDHKDHKDSTKTYTIKGLFQLVLDTKEHLEQQFSGRASCTLPLLPHHHEALEKQTLGSLRRLQEKFSVVLTLEAPSGTHEARIQGPTEGVHHAKKELLKLMEKYFPTEIAFVEPSVYCLKDVFGDSFVTEARRLGVLATVDRAQSFVLLTGTSGSLDAARQLVARLTAQWEDCHASIPIDASVVPALVGKSGASINALRKETKVSIEISPSNTSVDIKGANKEVVQEARAVIEKRIHQLLSERWEVNAPSEFFPILIGKQGANIIKLRADTGANIDVDGNTIKVHGAEEKVAAAKTAILELLSSSEAKIAGSKVLVVPAPSVAIIIGAKGATVRDIQDRTGTRFDFDRVSHKCSIKGRFVYHLSFHFALFSTIIYSTFNTYLFSVEGVESAIKLVDELLSREGFPAAYVEGHAPLPAPATAPVAAVDADVAEEAQPERRGVKSLPGAPPSLLQKTNTANLSKSALKRLRRKQAVEADGEGDADEGEEENEEDGEGAPSFVPVLPPVVEEVPLPAVAVPAPAQVPVAVAPVAVPAPARTAAPPALSQAPTSRVGVIGTKSPKAVDAPTFDFPPQATTSFALNPADQHHYHQQHLINLLLGGDTPAPSAGLYGAPAQSAFGGLQIPAYQAAPAQDYSSHYNNSYGYSAQPSAALYAAPAPPGIVGRPASGAASLSVHTAAPGGLDFSAARTAPPPPGLSPVGGVTSSRFSFGDDYSTSPAPLNVPALPQYQYKTPPQTQTSYTAPGVPAQPAAAPASNYYKSKSGFSVRL